MLKFIIFEMGIVRNKIIEKIIFEGNKLFLWNVNGIIGNVRIFLLVGIFK